MTTYQAMCADLFLTGGPAAAMAATAVMSGTTAPFTGESDGGRFVGVGVSSSPPRGGYRHRRKKQRESSSSMQSERTVFGTASAPREGKIPLYFAWELLGGGRSGRYRPPRPRP